MTAKERKERPVYSGVLRYFPDALLEVAHCSFIGNEQRRLSASCAPRSIADDSWAITFQSLGQYRSALLKAWRATAPAVQQED